MEPTTIVGAIAVIVTAAIASYVNFRIAAKRASGQVNTTTAESLWEEQREFRKDMANQLQHQREEIEDLRKRVQTLEDDNRKLTDENFSLGRTVKVLEQEVDRFKTDNVQLQRENESLRSKAGWIENNPT